MAQDEVLTRISTGISGLNEILHGWLVRERSYLVRGGPGTGKTTMGMHFLASGAAAGEAVLWISLGEPETKLRQNATAQGFDLQGVMFLDLSPSAEWVKSCPGKGSMFSCRLPLAVARPSDVTAPPV